MHDKSGSTATLDARSEHVSEYEIPLEPFRGTPEEIERQWYNRCYRGRGDTIPQLTLRAVLMGGVIGMFMSLSNLYTTVKLGWAFGVAITACVISFTLWSALRALTFGRLSQMTILENNCMQSTASAAGYSTGGTIGTAFGALLLITGEHVSWKILLPFTFLTAALGVFLAIPMKRQMINIEQLKFPSGIAAAETLCSLYSRGVEALHKAYSLIAALIGGALIGFLRTSEGLLTWVDRLLGHVRIPETIPFSTSITGITRATYSNFGFEPSMLLIGAGMIVGLRVSLSMLVGSALLYFVVAPWLVARDFEMAGTEGFVPSFVMGPGGIFNPVRWALWGGTAVMVFSSLAAVALQWPTISRSFKIFSKNRADDTHVLPRDIEVPFSWFMIGMIPIGIGLVALNAIAFNMSVLLGVISVALSFVVALVCCRATGETDTTPIGAMGKVTQLLYAVLAKGNVSINLMSAGVTAAAGGSSADLLTDLKSGYLLGANARKQFIAQFLGIFFGTVVIVPAWYLMFPTAETLDHYNPPAANMWRAVAEALTKGLDTVPVTAQWAIVFGGLVGIILPVLSHLFPKAAPYMPSAMGLGLAWVMPSYNALSFAIGAVLAWIWGLLHRKSAGTFVIPIASGLIAGESLMAAIIAILVSLPAALPEVWKALGF
ncbi:MAG: OPT/YSL family transporter [Phycisphaerae bacterium]|jgi:putative OPT family oligopeptide transporter